MPFVGTTAGDDVDDTARSVTELGFVTCGYDLKFENGVLIELAGGSAIEIVTVGEAVDEKEGVATAFAEDWGRVVAAGIVLAIEGDAGNELEKVEIVAAVDGHFFDLSGRDGASRRGRGRFQ